MFKVERLQVSPSRTRRAIMVEGQGRAARVLNLTGSQLMERVSDKLNSAALAIAFTPREYLKINEDYAVPSYRFVAYLSALASAVVMKFSARREGIDESSAVKAFLWGTLAGGVGALGLYHLETMGMDKQTLVEGLLMPPRPGQEPFWGFSWFGGLTASIPAMLFYAKIKKIPLGKFLDAMAPAGLVFHALARVGCFVSGDTCHGSPTDLPWGVAVNGAIRHPAPLYHTVSDLLTAIVVWRMSGNKKFTGQSFLTALSVHSLSRFAIEFVRDNGHIWGSGLSGYQMFSLGLFSLSTALLGWLGLRASRNEGNNG